MIPQCIDQGVGVLPWSPLARGLLAGNRTREGERLTRSRGDGLVRRLALQAEIDFDVVDRVVEVAGARGVPPAQVALAWLLHKPGVTAPIVGATKAQHVEDAIARRRWAQRRRDRAARGAVRPARRFRTQLATGRGFAAERQARRVAFAIRRPSSSSTSHSVMPTVRPRDDAAARDEAARPERAQEVDLQLERRERLAGLERRERHPHRRVGEVAEDPAVDRAHRVRVALLGDHRHTLAARRARRRSRSAPRPAAATSQPHHRADDVAAAQVVERMLDVVQRDRLRHHPCEVELAVERPLREPREVDRRPVVAAVRDDDARAPVEERVQLELGDARPAAAGRCRRACPRGRASRGPARPSPDGRRRRTRSRAARPAPCASRRNRRAASSFRSSRSSA